MASSEDRHFKQIRLEQCLLSKKKIHIYSTLYFSLTFSIFLPSLPLYPYPFCLSSFLSPSFTHSTSLPFSLFISLSISLLPLLITFLFSLCNSFSSSFRSHPSFFVLTYLLSFFLSSLMFSPFISLIILPCFSSSLFPFYFLSHYNYVPLLSSLSFFPDSKTFSMFLFSDILWDSLFSLICSLSLTIKTTDAKFGAKQKYKRKEKYGKVLFRYLSTPSSANINRDTC